MAFNYEVVENYGQLDSDSDAPKELRLISWNGGTPKYDLRGWWTEGDQEHMTKGITLDREELLSLYEILQEMLDSEKEENNEDEESNS